MPAESTEIVPGEYDVVPAGGGRTVRVLVPAGVGLPGVDEQDLAAAIVDELSARGRVLPATLDVSELLHGDAALVTAAGRRVDEADG